MSDDTGELERLKTDGNKAEQEIETLRKMLEKEMKKNQNLENILNKVSNLLQETLTMTARTTYVCTLAQDIISNRNMMEGQ